MKISIDDFGIGYPNLLAISLLKFDTLKTDKTLIDKIGKDKKIDTIVHGFKMIMDKNDIITIAEGVESEEQYHSLLEYQYEYAQGYYFSKPKNIVDLQEEIKSSIKNN